MTTNQPNIVFLLNDHQAHYGHGKNGGPEIQRPNFDRLAAEGINYERAYTACPLCGPARRTMLTGLFPHNHGEIKNNSDHEFDKKTYIEYLNDAGYRNYYYGKWHAGPGNAKDFGCEGFNYPSYNNPYTKPEYLEYLKGRDLPEPKILIERNFWPEFMKDGWHNTMKAGELYTQKREWCNEHASGVMTTPSDTHEAFFLANTAVEKLEELAASKKDKPFMVRVDFWGPHQPYFPSQEYADLYTPEDIPVYPNFNDDLTTKPEIYQRERALPLNNDDKINQPSSLPWAEWQKVLARAYAQVTMVDAAGGRILDAIDRLGLAENTIVIWSTDHGDALACHGGHFDKRSYMPEEVMRVPLALRWPGHIPGGQVSQALVSNIDFAPSFIAAAGIENPSGMDGNNLLAAAAIPDTEIRSDLMCETHGHLEDHIGRLLVTDRYKFVSNKGQMDELYNLQSDPYEMTNLIDNPKYSNVCIDMKKRLARWKTSTQDTTAWGNNS